MKKLCMLLAGSIVLLNNSIIAMDQLKTGQADEGQGNKQDQGQLVPEQAAALQKAKPSTAHMRLGQSSSQSTSSFRAKNAAMQAEKSGQSSPISSPASSTPASIASSPRHSANLSAAASGQLPVSTVQVAAQRKEKWMTELTRKSAQDNLSLPILHAAAYYNKVEAINDLLDAGASIDGKDSDGDTALISAAKNNSLDAIRCLIRRNADVEAKGRNDGTALHYAVKKGKLEAAQLLISAGGANVNASDEDGRTPLLTATFLLWYQDVEIIKLLCDNGANGNASDFHGDTALHDLMLLNIEASQKELIARYLTRQGAGVNARNKSGNTPLDQYRQFAVAQSRYIIKGETPHAREKKYQERNALVVQLLKSHGAKESFSCMIM